MQFVFHAEAGAQSLVLEGESFTHIFSARRSRATHNLALRNLRDDRLYTYKVESISKVIRIWYHTYSTTEVALRINRGKDEQFGKLFGDDW